MSLLGKAKQLVLLLRNHKTVDEPRRVTEVDVLIEGPSQETDLLWQARMSTQAPEIDGFCYINDFAGAEPRRATPRPWIHRCPPVTVD